MQLILKKYFCTTYKDNIVATQNVSLVFVLMDISVNFNP